jgi:hypothetical protein
MVSASLVWFCLTCRDNPDFVRSQCVSDGQEAVINHAKKDQAMLAVVLAVVHEIDGEWIIEGFSSLLEANGVLGKIGCRLRIIPFEIVRIHNITDYP